MADPKQAHQLRELLNQSTAVWIGLGVAFIALAVLVQRIRAWYQGGDDPADMNDEIMRQMKEMNRRGDLSDEEFRSIKGRSQGRRT